MKSAFEILQKHHDYLQKNGEKPSEYEEDRILAAMEEYANLKIDFMSSSTQLKDKQIFTFEEWYITYGYTKTINGNFVKDGSRIIYDELLHKYKVEYLKTF